MKNLFLGFSSRVLIHAFTDSGEALYDSSYIVVLTDLKILFLPPKLAKSKLLNQLKPQYMMSHTMPRQNR